MSARSASAQAPGRAMRRVAVAGGGGGVTVTRAARAPTRERLARATLATSFCSERSYATLALATRQMRRRRAAAADAESSASQLRKRGPCYSTGAAQRLSYGNCGRWNLKHSTKSRVEVEHRLTGLLDICAYPHYHISNEVNRKWDLGTCLPLKTDYF